MVTRPQALPHPSFLCALDAPRQRKGQGEAACHESWPGVLDLCGGDKRTALGSSDCSTSPAGAAAGSKPACAAGAGCEGRKGTPPCCTNGLQEAQRRESLHAGIWVLGTT